MSDKPNILLIYADQMRYDAMGCAGNPVVRTPNIDRLAGEGVQFTEAYTSYPICCPFRASVMTGKYAQGHGMVQNHFPLRGGQVFLGDLMGKAGYRTGYVGKWHLEGGPKPGFVPPGRRFGWEHFVGFNRGHEYMSSIYYDNEGQAYHSRRYEPDYQTDQIIDFIASASRAGAGDGKPWIGYVSYGPPHFPMDMPDDVRGLYDPGDVPLPPGVPDMDLQRRFQKRRNEAWCRGEPDAGHQSHARGDTIPIGEPETEADIRRFIAEYYGMVHNIDWNLGRILDELDRQGAADNTMVMFFSDHGDMFGQHGYYCGIKSTAYRASMHVPLVVRHPDRFGPRKTAAMVDVGPDMMPTLLEACGAGIPEGIDGESYLSVLDGRAEEARDAIWYQNFAQTGGNPREFSPYAERGIRTKDWLYMRHRDERIMLHDEREDYHEQNNLVGNPAHSALMDEFDARIDAHMKATGDDWEMAADFPPPDWVTHAEAKEHLEKVLLPSAIEVP